MYKFFTNLPDSNIINTPVSNKFYWFTGFETISDAIMDGSSGRFLVSAEDLSGSPTIVKPYITSNSVEIEKVSDWPAKNTAKVAIFSAETTLNRIFPLGTTKMHISGVPIVEALLENAISIVSDSDTKVDTAITDAAVRLSYSSMDDNNWEMYYLVNTSRYALSAALHAAGMYKDRDDINMGLCVLDTARAIRAAKVCAMYTGYKNPQEDIESYISSLTNWKKFSEFQEDQ
jgi:hypothetical protein